MMPNGIHHLTASVPDRSTQYFKALRLPNFLTLQLYSFTALQPYSSVAPQLNNSTTLNNDYHKPW